MKPTGLFEVTTLPVSSAPCVICKYWPWLSVLPLEGKPIEKELETRASATGTDGAAATAAANPGSLETPYFYTGANEAKVHLAMEVPPSSIT